MALAVQAPVFAEVSKRWNRGERLRHVFLVSIAAIVVLTGCSSLPKGGGQVDAVKNQAAAYAAQGNSSYEKGDYVRAERYFKLALDADFSVDNRLGVASSYNSLGRVYLSAGDFEAAKDAFDHAEEYSRPAVSPESQSLTLAARTGTAEILLLQGHYASALEALKKAESLPVPEDSVERAALYHDIGAAYKGLERYQEARSYLEQALEIHRKLKRGALEASDLYMLASLSSKQGDYTSAVDYLEKALAQDKRVENSVGIGSDLRALGIVSEKQRKEASAYDYYYRSLQVYRILGMAGQVKDLLGRLARVATALGRQDEADSYTRALAEMEAVK